MNLDNYHKLTDIALRGKSVLLRLDLNIPLSDINLGVHFRIMKTLKTINYLLDQNAKITIISHLGRPNGKNPVYTLEPVANLISTLLNKKIKFLPYTITDDGIIYDIKKSLPGEIIMLENTRFTNDEEECNIENILNKSILFDYFINDSFATIHRKHLSTYGIATIIPSVIGFLVEEEIKKIDNFKNGKFIPTIILGGSKIKTKLAMIKYFLHRSPHILLGGVMANTFMKAKGINIGKSKYEESEINLAKKILSDSENKIVLPVDVIVQRKNKPIMVGIEEISENDIIYDIGKNTRSMFAKYVNEANSIIFNGPLGMFEEDDYDDGTHDMLKFIIDKEYSLIGGGDTLSALKKFHIDYKNYYHVSTGGGAMLYYFEQNFEKILSPYLK